MKSYAFAGASSRGLYMFALPLFEDFKDVARLVGVYDINVGRSRLFSQRVGDVPVFEDFDGMLRSAKPDCVIVTTVDAFHSEYIIRALSAGCDVITEKPMTTDEVKCRAILEMEKLSGKNVIVTFNYRYAPYASKVKELIQSGVIGDIYSVHFEWMLDAVMSLSGHGTSYFRRWNARMDKSGGLLVHKSTHHFDLINWWLESAPERVSAFGQLNAYGRKNAPYYGERCSTCAHARKCPYFYHLTDEEKLYYQNNETYDGYVKDNCVYAGDIDIYDTMSANVLYKNGAMLSYALNATNAYEGWRASINGSKGRLEAFLPETGQLSQVHYDSVYVYDLHNNIAEHRTPRDASGHGGGDVRLREMLFRGENLPDPLGYAAGTRDGARSILIGVAANKSIKEQRQVTIAELIGGDI